MAKKKRRNNVGDCCMATFLGCGPALPKNAHYYAMSNVPENCEAEKKRLGECTCRTSAKDVSLTEVTLQDLADNIIGELPIPTKAKKKILAAKLQGRSLSEIPALEGLLLVQSVMGDAIRMKAQEKEGELIDAATCSDCRKAIETITKEYKKHPVTIESVLAAEAKKGKKA